MPNVHQYDQLLTLARSAHAIADVDAEGELLQYAVLKAGSSRRDASKCEDVPFLGSPEQMARHLETVAHGWAGTEQKLFLCVFHKGDSNPALMRPHPPNPKLPTSEAPASGQTLAGLVETIVLDGNRRTNEAFTRMLEMQENYLGAREDLASVIAHSNHEEKPSDMLQALEMLAPMLPYLIAGKAPQLTAKSSEEAGPVEEELELPEMTSEEAVTVARGLVRHLCALCRAHPEATVPELAPLLQVDEVVSNLLQLA